MYRFIIILTAALVLNTNSFAVTTTDLTAGITPANLVAELIDTTASGITYSNITYKGANSAAGIFTQAQNDGLGLDRGLILSTGRISDAAGPNKCYKTTYTNRQPGDPQLGTSYDAAVLEFDFVPNGDKLEFQYVFASEEYNEFVNSNFNDVFAFFLDGKNIALLPETATEVAINSVNVKTNMAYFHNNAYPTPNNWNDYFRNPCQAGQATPFQTEFDGFTTVLKASATVTPGKTHHLKLAIADRGDYSLDSAVFIQGKSFRNPKPPVATTLITPQDKTDSLTPSFAWNIIANATQYRLKIDGATGTLLDQWYTTAEANCVADTNLCTVTSPLELADGGTYQWSVQTANEDGAGPWSETRTLQVEIPPPPPPVPPETETEVVVPPPPVTTEPQDPEPETPVVVPPPPVTTEPPPVTTEPQDPEPETPVVVPPPPVSEDPVTEVVPPPLPEPVLSCALYAVDDEERNDTQLIVFNQDTQTITGIGQKRPGYDIEALDAHPLTKQLYAAAGKDAETGADRLYQVNADNGKLTSLGPLSLQDGGTIDDISGLSFNPDTNQLWGWAQGKGLFKVNVDDLPGATAELKWASPQTIEDLTWNQDGTALYLAKDNKVTRYDGTDLTPVCALPKDKRIEALEMTPQGLLMVGLHDDNAMYLIDTTTMGDETKCQLTKVDLPMLMDIEGLAWICKAKEE